MCIELVAAGCCMCNKVVEAQSIYKKSYFWLFGNPTCGDSTGSSWTEKDKVLYLLDLFEGKREKGQCDLVCVKHL